MIWHYQWADYTFCSIREGCQLPECQQVYDIPAPSATWHSQQARQDQQVLTAEDHPAGPSNGAQRRGVESSLLQLKACNHENWEASLHDDQLQEGSPARKQTHYVSSKECEDETCLNVTRKESSMQLRAMCGRHIHTLLTHTWTTAHAYTLCMDICICTHCMDFCTCTHCMNICTCTSCQDERDHRYHICADLGLIPD